MTSCYHVICQPYVKLVDTMKLARIFFPVLLALALLFAQQSGVAHSLTHALDEQSQQNKHFPQSSACEQCAVYAQLGSALNSASCSFLVIAIPAEALHNGVIAFRSTLPPTAIARGPPAQLQIIT